MNLSLVNVDKIEILGEKMGLLNRVGMVDFMIH